MITDDETDERYKYLRVLQTNDDMQNKTEGETKQTYMKGINQVLKSKLNGRNEPQAVNSYEIAVISHTAGIISWIQNEIVELDMKTRKTLSLYGGLHPGADINRLYATRNQSGKA